MHELVRVGLKSLVGEIIKLEGAIARQYLRCFLSHTAVRCDCVRCIYSARR